MCVCASVCRCCRHHTGGLHLFSPIGRCSHASYACRMVVWWSMSPPKWWVTLLCRYKQTWKKSSRTIFLLLINKLKCAKKEREREQERVRKNGWKTMYIIGFVLMMMMCILSFFVMHSSLVAYFRYRQLCVLYVSSTRAARLFIIIFFRIASHNRIGRRVCVRLKLIHARVYARTIE